VLPDDAPFNLAAALLDQHLSAGRGDRPAFRHQGATVTYAGIAALAARAGHGLRAAGVAPGDRVVLLLADSPAFVATFLGALHIGAVPVTLSTFLSAEEYAYLFDDSGAKVAIVDGSTAQPAPTPGTTFDELISGQREMIETAPTRAGDMAFFQYSSGTTGRPKGVIHLHRNGVQPAQLHGRWVSEITPDDRVFSVPRLFFSFGLNNSLLVPLYHGASAVLEPVRPDAKRALAVIARERPTLFYNVPTGYAAILAAVEAGAPADLSSIRRCVSAGEALPAPIYERWLRTFGLEILDGIGSTEIGHICISNFPGRVRPGTSGTVIPGYDARVARADGSDAPDGEVGDLLVRGPSAARGYWRKPEATVHTFRDGWVFTGDRFTRDADGYFTYQGRSDDMLRVSGMWVSPLEVESALLRHPSVRECAVVARSLDDGLARPMAYVVADPAAKPQDLGPELHALAKTALAGYKRPHWIEFVSELPKTSTGKIQRFKLRRR
jgi:benzoate-CoA ligase family protein